MSFDFGTSNETASDPTADFLARERSAAGALGGDSDLFSHPTNTTTEDRDFAASASAFPSLDGQDSAPVTTTSNAPAVETADDGWGDDDMGFGSAPAAAAAPVVQKKDESTSQFENKFPQLDDEEEEMDMGKSMGNNQSVSELGRERGVRGFGDRVGRRWIGWIEKLVDVP